MKRKIYFFLIGSLFLMISYNSFSQPEELKAKLVGKRTYKEISETVEQYLNTSPASYEKERLEKHFARWAYYQSLHLGPEGEFVNISKKTLEAVSSQTDASTTSANGAWTFVGPNISTTNNPGADLNGNGRADRIAFDHSNSSIIYVGTPAGGLWKTTNGGLTWIALSNYIPSLGISGIVVDNNDPNTLYVLTGDGDTYIPSYVLSSGYHRLSVGVLVSHDGGATWQQTGQLSANDYAGYRLIQHPTNSSILIAATSDGLYRTTNGGNTWVLEHAGKHYDVEFKPGNPTIVYSSGVAAIYYSTNTGDTWSNATVDIPLCTDGRVELGVSANSPGRVFAVAGPKGAGNTFCGFYESVNSGTSYTRLCNSPNVLGKENGTGDQSVYDIGVTVKPSNYQTIIVCGLTTYKSTNGGSVFSSLTTYRESGGNYIHPDVHDVAFNPLNNYLYAATDGGFYRSTDDGESWTVLNSGINTAQFYHLDDFDGAQYTMLAGCQDNGIKYKTANSSTFSHILCCDGFDAVIDYTDQTRGYVSMNSGIWRFTNFITTDPGNSIVNGGDFMQIELNSSNPDILYLSSSGVYKYTASTGVLSAQLGTAKGHWCLRTCPSNSNKLYAAGGSSAFAATGEMYMSTNGGTSWDTISDQSGFPASFPRISDIGVNPTNSALVYACLSGYTNGLKVMYSANSGTSWTNISYDLPNIPVWSIEVDAANNIYIGCDIGVYYRAAGATHWEPYYNNLPNVPVSDLAINEGADQLLAATFGRGIWKSQLRGSCPVDLAIGSNVAGPYFKSASNSISMSGQVTGGSGTTAVLRSGGYVDLLPGFRADSDPGNKFLAYLGACNSGMPPAFIPQQGSVLSEFEGYETTLNRQSGTIEIDGTGDSRQMVIHQNEDGPFRVLLSDGTGKYIRVLVNEEGRTGQSVYSLPGNDLKPGLYYIFLVVNKKVTHIQELEIE